MLRELHKARPQLPILIVTMFPEDQLALRLLEMGACAALLILLLLQAAFASARLATMMFLTLPVALVGGYAPPPILASDSRGAWIGVSGGVRLYPLDAEPATYAVGPSPELGITVFPAGPCA